MKTPQPPLSFEWVALGVLIYEFPTTDEAESEKKIRGRLKRRKLGPYDAERVEELRRLKNELQKEIGKGEASAYYTIRHDKQYVDMRDFDVPRMIEKWSKRFPTIARIELESFVPFCVFTYYLR